MSWKIQEVRHLDQRENPQFMVQISNGKESRMKKNELDIQMLRIKVQTQLVQYQQSWKLKEQDLCQFFKNYTSLPSSKVSPSQLFQKENVKLIRTENKIYLGQIYNKKKHGEGIIFSKGGKIYEGQFYNNDKQGFASEIYSNGNLYFGAFHQNKKHGKGTFYWFSLFDEKNPNNRYHEQYHGEWWGGLPDGHGEHQKCNGDYYVGKFKNGLKHGEGFQSYFNGDKYKGQFVNGLPQGYGEYIWSDKSFYKGDFKQGYRNGYGVWKNGQNDKEYYKGHYVLDKKNGYGIYDWGNGYVYKGNFLDDVRSGEGDLYFQNQLVYSGYWENGQKNEEYRPEKEEIHHSRNQSEEDRQRKKSIQKPQRNFSSTHNKKQLNSSYCVDFKQVQPERRCRRRGCYACQYKYNQSKEKPRLNSSSVSKIKN